MVLSLLGAHERASTKSALERESSENEEEEGDASSSKREVVCVLGTAAVLTAIVAATASVDGLVETFVIVIGGRDDDIDVIGIE